MGSEGELPISEKARSNKRECATRRGAYAGQFCNPTVLAGMKCHSAEAKEARRIVLERIQKGGLADRWKGGRLSKYAALHEKKHSPMFLLDVDGRQVPPDVARSEVVDYILSKSANRSKHHPTQLTFTTDERNFVRVSQKQDAKSFRLINF